MAVASPPVQPAPQPAAPDQAAILAAIYDALHYNPSDAQIPILMSPYRETYVSGGIQAGKSLTASKFFTRKYLEDLGQALIKRRDLRRKPLRYWLVARDYNRTLSEWEYIKTDMMVLGNLSPKNVTKRVDPGHMEFIDGTIVETVSGEDPRKLAMFSPDGILGCEASQLDITTHYKIKERLAASRGWFYGGGTMEGSLGYWPSIVSSLLYARRGDARAFLLPTHSNLAVFPGGENDPEILRQKRDLPPELFQERFLGIPCPPSGMVFKEVDARLHIEDIAYVPDTPVHLAVDPGYGGAYAVLAIQVINGQVQVFDEIYERGMTNEEITSIAMNKPWWGSEGKCNVKWGVIDQWGGLQHHSEQAPVEAWMKQTGLYLGGQKVGINDGNDRFRTYLKMDPVTKRPRMVISPVCKGLISELGLGSNPFDNQNHAYSWKTDREGNIVGDTPEQKWNHSISALTYWLVNQYGYARSESVTHGQVMDFKPSHRKQYMELTAGVR